MGLIASTRGLGYLIIIIIIIAFGSCTGNKIPVQEKAEYDTLAVVQTMFQDSTIKRLLYNADSKRTYNDSVYIVRSELSDSVLSAVKLHEKKIGFLPPDERPYTYKNIADKQILWVRIISLQAKEAIGELSVNGYNIIREIEMLNENGKWKIKKSTGGHF